MIVRVTLEIALRQEFDYLVPEALEDQVEIGTRVKVPFGHREVMGCVTAIVETSEHKNLRPISHIIGTQSLVTPKVLRIARWIAEYYCCAPETALKSVLPEAVRREKDGWKEQLHVTPLTPPEPASKLTKRQQEIVDLLRQRGEMRLQQFAELAETTAETVRRLEDKGYLRIAQKTMERDPYANEQIVATQQLVLSAEQKVALDAITEALAQCAAGLKPAVPSSPAPTPPIRPLESLFFNREAGTTKFSGWLPHWRQAGKLYFVTFRLADSIAQDHLRALAAEKETWERVHPKPWSEKNWHDYNERFISKVDRWLDSGHGSCALAKPEIGNLVANAFKHFDEDRYQLGDFVVMPNHVHVLVRPAPEHDRESSDAAQDRAGTRRGGRTGRRLLW